MTGVQTCALPISMLAAQVKNPDEKHATIKEMFFYAQTLHFSKSPYAAKVQLKDTEDTIVLDLNHIQEIKLVYQGMDV